MMITSIIVRRYPLIMRLLTKMFLVQESDHFDDFQLTVN